MMINRKSRSNEVARLSLECDVLAETNILYTEAAGLLEPSASAPGVLFRPLFYLHKALGVMPNLFWKISEKWLIFVYPTKGSRSDGT